VAALKAGNDIVLIVSPDANKISQPQNKEFITSTILAIEKAVDKHVLSKQVLAQAVAHKLSAQRISACQIIN
jgi:hypothetical protein